MEYESKRDREKLPSMPLKTQSKYYAFERQMKAECEDLCESEILCDNF